MTHIIVAIPPWIWFGLALFGMLMAGWTVFKTLKWAITGKW